MLSEQQPKSLETLATERGRYLFGCDGAQYALGALGGLLNTIEGYLAHGEYQLAVAAIDTARKSLSNG